MTYIYLGILVVWVGLLGWLFTRGVIRDWKDNHTR
jgi:hypothetical protein